MQTVNLDMRNITKVYPNGVVANNKVNFSTNSGEIHALMGENGAGKSTLMKILFGNEKLTSGEIFIFGKSVKINNPMDSIKLGVGMVHQHFMLDEQLTVGENIILGMEPTRNGLLDFKKIEDMVVEVSEKYKFNIKPSTKVMDLEVGKKQKVEILKALIRGAKILILDEPTAVLTPQETKELFEQLKLLKKEGHTIIFISHKLNEIKEICDRITIMRSGKDFGCYDVANISISEISSLMLGRDVVTEISKSEPKPREVVLKVEELFHINDEGQVDLNKISFNVRRGEILGIAGVEGNGQRALIDCISGLETHYKGSVYIDDKLCYLDNAPKERRNLGLSHIPEDRMVYGTMPDESIKENIMANLIDNSEYKKGILLDKKKIDDLTKELVVKFQIKTDSIDTPIRMLSGGNMQKVVAAREMSSDFKILIADQPTRGIDVGTAAFIRNNIVELRDDNKAILLVSADLNEVIELSDSLIVMYDGEITAYYENTSKIDENELGMYMLGLKKMDDEIIRKVANNDKK